MKRASLLAPEYCGMLYDRMRFADLYLNLKRTLIMIDLLVKTAHI